MVPDVIQSFLHGSFPAALQSHVPSRCLWLDKILRQPCLVQIFHTCKDGVLPRADFAEKREIEKEKAELEALKKKYGVGTDAEDAQAR